MVMSEILERFVQGSPVTVMARLTLQRALSPEWVNNVFEHNRQQQYTRELMFSTVVDLMSLVALGQQPSLHAAAQADPELPVSLAALYAKINHAKSQSSQLWLADRNFCTRAIIGALQERGACYLLREHAATCRPTAQGRRRPRGRVQSGMVYEQAVQVALDGDKLLS